MERTDATPAHAQHLKRVGMTYREVAEYLGVTVWRAMRLIRPSKTAILLVVARANGRCENCSKLLPHGQVHHADTYPDIPYNDVRNLLYLCPRCHKWIHNVETSCERARSAEERRAERRRLRRDPHAKL